MLLTDREWKEFKIGNSFDVVGSKTTKVDILQRKGIGIYPYVTTQTSDNGQAGYYNYYTEKGCALAVDSAVAGFCTYQQNNFTASDHVEKLIPKFKINREIGLFFSIVINNNNSKKYSYGYKASQTRLRETIIMLPVNTTGKPDYTFMEAYIKEQENRKKQEYIDYAKKVLAKLEYKEVPALKEKTYGEFKVLDLFDCKRGNQNNMNSLIEGNNMLISAKNINNGLKGFYKGNDDKKTVYQGDCITLNNDGDGGVGLAYYQPYKFLLDTHVYALYSKTDINMCAKLYITLALSKQRICFSHGRSISKERLEKMKIMLPINEKNQPDYAYMEQYAKNIEFKKITQYLDYLNSIQHTAS